MISSFVRIVQNLEPAAIAAVCAFVRISLYLFLNADNSRTPMVLSPTLPQMRNKLAEGKINKNYIYFNYTVIKMIKTWN